MGLITRVLSTGGRGEASPQTSHSPPKKSFTEKKLQLFQIKIFLTTILRNQWRLLMSRNAISANPEHYIFKLFQGSMPPDPLRRPKKNFYRRHVAQKFFSGSTSPPPPLPKQNILDITLITLQNKVLQGNPCVQL